MEQVVNYLLMVQKLSNLKQKIQRLQQIHYVQETFQNTDQQKIQKKKTGLNGYVYDFSADYDAIAVDDILDIYKYLMKQNNNNMIYKCLGLSKNCFLQDKQFCQLYQVQIH